MVQHPLVTGGQILLEDTAGGQRSLRYSGDGVAGPDPVVGRPHAFVALHPVGQTGILVDILSVFIFGGGQDRRTGERVPTPIFGLQGRPVVHHLDFLENTRSLHDLGDGRGLHARPGLVDIRVRNRHEERDKSLA